MAAKKVTFNEELAAARESLSQPETMETLTIESYKEEVKKYLPKVIARQSVVNIPHHQAVEVEMRTVKDFQLAIVKIKRNQRERVLIEQSLSTVRISIVFQHVNNTHEIMMKSFNSTRDESPGADKFVILRQTPVEGYDISFLLTSQEPQNRTPLADFVVNFLQKMEDNIEAQINAALAD
ncbi:hypothetical protein LSTR_LSTR008137 [Laodelphax striatellus]|uniref:Uncharacterized protein n=1 Tax=Laodelphax striatellus TaxID=195883 RepID=A0A482WYV1_LAOST|nr:hypothetical protein LSTR_LSTR008137 [Laodelphax striatellus]